MEKAKSNSFCLKSSDFPFQDWKDGQGETKPLPILSDRQADRTPLPLFHETEVTSLCAMTNKNPFGPDQTSQREDTRTQGHLQGDQAKGGADIPLPPFPSVAQYPWLSGPISVLGSEGPSLFLVTGLKRGTQQKAVVS